MPTLVCAVVGDGRPPFSVEVGANRTIHVLKEVIQENIMYGDFAHTLDLYRVNGLTADEDGRCEYHGATIDMTNCSLETFGADKKVMPAAYWVSYFFNQDDEPIDRKVHVLVVLPDAVVPRVAPADPNMPLQVLRRSRRGPIDNGPAAHNTSSIAFAEVTWSQVRRVFQPTPYIQPYKPLPDAQLASLAQYLSVALKCLEPITHENDAARVHVVAPILVCVCSLFNGDAMIQVDEYVKGVHVKAHGELEFVLRRGDKTVCITTVTKDNMSAGMAHVLLGCEVQAELGHLDQVFGIVTDCLRWNLLRSLNGVIELDECTLAVGPTGPDLASLGIIAGKMYAMLSDD
ncbi:hypothetical protein B5M09_013533 [Aphanomyces astaci]|uniref:Crinkler effector protein N-terminal domain-containing protein n=1 Tax=Aphanomyces astaci TaxID=112090 RepID=A0A425D4C6_APHAT|nr:hypothetical protein B5M09_013533 [Aphanomyces astaci]